MPSAAGIPFAQAWLLETRASASRTGPSRRHASGMAGRSHSWCAVAPGTRCSTDGRAPRKTSGIASGRSSVVTMRASGKAATISSTHRSDPA